MNDAVFRSCIGSKDQIDLYDYWCSLRSGRPLPRRGDVDPGRMGSVLPYISLVEVFRSERCFRRRLVGTGIAEFYGRDRTGEVIYEHTGGPIDTLLWGLYEEATLRACAVYMHSCFDYSEQASADVQRLVLPLANEDGDVFQLLCSLRPSLEHPATVRGNHAVDESSGLEVLLRTHEKAAKPAQRYAPRQDRLTVIQK